MTEDHLTNTPLRCINCKGNHASSHKECNTCRIRLGLKPIPHKTEGTHKKNTTNHSQNQPPKLNHKRKEKGKGKDTESPNDRDPSTRDIRLSSTDITSLLANNPTRSEQHEHTVKLIHNQAKEKLIIKIPA